MIINPLSALQGIGSASEVGTAVAGTANATSVAAGSFAEIVGAAARDTAAGLRESEAVSMDALQGKADTREVVDAIMSAEQALQAAISIRDKIVSSYLEVSRMAI